MSVADPEPDIVCKADPATGQIVFWVSPAWRNSANTAAHKQYAASVFANAFDYAIGTQKMAPGAQIEKFSLSGKRESLK